MEGEVDERPIQEVQASDLRTFQSIHLFCGVAVWSYALRNAGWPDDRPVWTGSVPCQPFSAAGRRLGTADERHLWPEMLRLVRECRPGTVFGEQVASDDALDWLDVVFADLEAEGYACGAVDLCAAGLGAPHIRQRLYWVAHTRCEREGRRLRRPGEGVDTRGVGAPDEPERSGGASGLADAESNRARHNEPKSEWRASCVPVTHSTAGGLADAMRDGRGARSCGNLVNDAPEPSQHRARSGQAGGRPGGSGRPGAADDPLRGFWRDPEWLPCRDGKARPTQSWPIEMADGLADRLGFVRTGEAAYLAPLIQAAPARAGRLRAYGNAIVAPVAEAFIRSYMDVCL